MKIYYSASTRGFYDNCEGRYGKDEQKKIPSDAQVISAEYYAELLSEQSIGRQITPDENGYPFALRPPTVSIEERRERKCRILESDMHQYISIQRGYPVFTQITLQAIYSDPDSNNTQKVACKAIFNWVKKSLLPYYYGVKAQIMASGTPESVSWDFSGCDADAPGYTLSQIIQM